MDIPRAEAGEKAKGANIDAEDNGEFAGEFLDNAKDGAVAAHDRQNLALGGECHLIQGGRSASERSGVFMQKERDVQPLEFRYNRANNGGCGWFFRMGEKTYHGLSGVWAREG
jgi:hypothetical protein